VQPPLHPGSHPPPPPPGTLWPTRGTPRPKTPLFLGPCGCSPALPWHSAPARLKACDPPPRRPTRNPARRPARFWSGLRVGVRRPPQSPQQKHPPVPRRLAGMGPRLARMRYGALWGSGWGARWGRVSNAQGGATRGPLVCCGVMATGLTRAGYEVGHSAGVWDSLPGGLRAGEVWGAGCAGRGLWGLVGWGSQCAAR
jgi:hypothetical protein